MENQIKNEIKQARSKKLIELSNKNEEEFLNKYINKEIGALFENEENGYYRGHTTNYILVNVKSKENINNKILKVKADKQDKLELFGELL